MVKQSQGKMISSLMYLNHGLQAVELVWACGEKFGVSFLQKCFVITFLQTFFCLNHPKLFVHVYKRFYDKFRTAD